VTARRGVVGEEGGRLHARSHFSFFYATAPPQQAKYRAQPETQPESQPGDGHGRALGGLEAFFVRVAPADRVQDFLDLVRGIYARLPACVAAAFGTAAAAAAGPGGASAGAAAMTDDAGSKPGAPTEATTAAGEAVAASSLPPPGAHRRGMDSFRVLTECPLIVMLLFQLYPDFISSLPFADPAAGVHTSGNIPLLVPLMMDGLRLAAPLTAAAASESAAAAAAATAAATAGAAVAASANPAVAAAPAVGGVSDAAAPVAAAATVVTAPAPAPSPTAASTRSRLHRELVACQVRL